MLHARKLALGVVVSGLVVHALGGVVAKVLARVDLGQLFEPGSYLFFTAVAAPPFLATAALCWLLARKAEERPALRKALSITAGTVALLGLGAQVESWRGLASDAQAAIAFVVLPIGAGLVSFLVAVVSLVVAMVVDRRRAAAA